MVKHNPKPFKTDIRVETTWNEYTQLEETQPNRNHLDREAKRDYDKDIDQVQTLDNIRHMIMGVKPYNEKKNDPKKRS